MKTFILSTALIVIAASLCRADTETIVVGGLDGIDPNSPVVKNEIVMALSGGGARGLASIGIIKAFEEKNIAIAAITGTSMGGVIAGLYACGYTPDELSSIVSDLDFSSFFVDAPGRQTMFLTRRQDFERHLLSIRFDKYKPVIPQGWTGGQKITAVLNRMTTKANYRCGGDFNKLKIPFKTVATDVISGNEVILDSGSISEAMRASMAFPLALTAVETNGYVLMDGGMVTPIPVTIARTMD
ncbi:MAG: patatin-like phospholipase family protein, partial [Candidatus Zixiibacteriota bacterium]